MLRYLDGLQPFAGAPDAVPDSSGDRLSRYIVEQRTGEVRSMPPAQARGFVPPLAQPERALVVPVL